MTNVFSPLTSIRSWRSRLFQYFTYHYLLLSLLNSLLYNCIGRSIKNSDFEDRMLCADLYRLISSIPFIKYHKQQEVFALWSFELYHISPSFFCKSSVAKAGIGVRPCKEGPLWPGCFLVPNFYFHVDSSSSRFYLINWSSFFSLSIRLPDTLLPDICYFNIPSIPHHLSSVNSTSSTLHWRAIYMRAKNNLTR